MLIVCSLLPGIIYANHPDLATSYGNIALIFLDLGKYETALKFQQKADNILKERLPENHPK